MFAPFHAACCEGRSLLQSLGMGRKQGRMELPENRPGWDKPGKSTGKHRWTAGGGPTEQNPATTQKRPTQPHFFLVCSTPSLHIFSSLTDLVPRVHFAAVGEKQQLLSGPCNSQSLHFHFVSFSLCKAYVCARSNLSPGHLSMWKCQMYFIFVWPVGILHLSLNRETKLNSCLLVTKTWDRTVKGNTQQ